MDETKAPADRSRFRFKLEDIKEAMSRAEVHLAVGPTREKGGRVRLTWAPATGVFTCLTSKDDVVTVRKSAKELEPMFEAFAEQVAP